MSRILVIGAKGMLGRDLVKILQSPKYDHEVIGWDIEDIDICEEENTIKKIQGLSPEIIINTAAFTDVDACETIREKVFAINAEGAKHVALGALKCGAKIIYISTDYIFDGKKREPYLETDTPNPINVYGWSKLKGERYVQDLVENSLIIRTQWLFGRYGKNFVSSILKQARQKKMLSIVNDQIGSPTYTIDLSEAISIMIEHNLKGIFHVTNQDVCSWYTFGKAIIGLARIPGIEIKPISSKESGRLAQRPSYSVLSNQKLKKETGMVLRTWSEALKDYLDLIEKEEKGVLL
jgi:dTDP-4-dehydrorhamnose reductase